MPNETVRAAATGLPNSSRRLFLAAGSAAAVFATVKHAAAAAPAGVDPIFAAIERHKDAWRAFSDAAYLTDDVLAEEEGRLVMEGAEAAYEAANEAEVEALTAALSLPPVTVAGARALIQYGLDIHEEGAGEFWTTLAATLLESPVLAAGDGRA